jgi:hypothetical protein
MNRYEIEDLVLGLADIVTIDYGRHHAQYTGQYADEAQWHSNAKYWVSETYLTELCATNAILGGPDIPMVLRSLNTKPDGTGINVPATPGHFYWEPLAEYQMVNVMKLHYTLLWSAMHTLNTALSIMHGNTETQNPPHAQQKDGLPIAIAHTVVNIRYKTTTVDI